MPGFSAEPTVVPPSDTAAPAAAPVPDEAPRAATPTAEPASSDARGLRDWLPLILPALAALLLLGWLLRRRRMHEASMFDEQPLEAEFDEQAEVIPVPEIASETDLVPAPDVANPEDTAVALAAAAVEARPDLEIVFRPAAASATDAQAAVEFALTVVNNGTAPARRVRMEARMFAMGAGHDAALAAFLAEPLENAVAVAAVIEPGVQAVLRSQVTLPRDRVQPIQVQNRSLFVPLVAFKILYDFGDGDTGQSAMSFVVGRENKPPAAKMAPFRLDQGPRIYREVGQRVHVPPRAA